MELTERQPPATIPVLMAATGNHGGNGAASGNMDDPMGGKGAATYSVPEASRLLGWSERTLRHRVKTGKVAGVLTEQGYRIAATVVERLRQPAPPLPPHGGTMAASDPELPDVAVLQARLDGAHLAAKLHAQRYREERDRAARIEAEAREREAFLQAQLQARTDAERELRLLLAQSAQAIQAINARPALEAHPAPTRTRWWWLWRRG